MERDAHYTLVGLFVVIMLAAGFLFMGLFTEREYGGQYRQYAVHFNHTIDGLVVGSEVRYMGVKVGEVTNISLLTPPQNGQRVMAILNVDAATPVDTATVATLRTQGLTGIAFLGLTQDANVTAPQALARHNNSLPVIPAQQSELSTVIERLPALEQKLDAVLTAAGEVLNESNREEFAALLGNLRTASDGAPALVAGLQRNSDQLGDVITHIDDALSAVEGLIAHIDLAVGDVSSTVKDVGKTVKRADGTIMRLETELRSSMQALRSTLSSIRQTSEKIGGLTGNVNRVVMTNESRVNELFGQGGSDLQQLLQEAKQTAQAVRALSDKLEQNPSQIIYQPAPQGVELPR